MEQPVKAKKQREYPSMNIKKVNGGYVLSSYGDNGEWSQIARSIDDVSKIVKRKLG